MQDESGREMLLALLRGEKDIDVPEEAWQRITRLAARHGVAEFLHQQLAKMDYQVPAGLWRELHKNYLLSAARNSFFYHELGKVLAAFNHESIAVIVLKGAYLAEHIYENISVRPMGDIDLLVLEDDLMRVDALLVELGFHRQFASMQRSDEDHAFPYKNAQTGLVIEIHWDLMSAVYGMQADIDGLWQRTLPSSIAHYPVLEMTAEDQILHLCIHASVHVFQMGLRALCDLNVTFQYFRDSIDWNCLHQRAQQWRAERCIYITLRLLHEILHTPITTAWLETIQPDGFLEQYYLLAKEHLFRSVDDAEEALPDATGVIRFWATEGWKRKLLVLFRRVFPSRDEMSRMYPAPPDSLRIMLYYPARFIDLLHRFGQLGVHLVLGQKQTIVRAERQNEVNDLRDWLITRKR